MFVCLFSTKQTTLATDICLLYLTILLLSYMDEHLVPGKVQALVEFASSAELSSHSTSSSSVYGQHKEGQILQTCLSKDVIYLLYILKGNPFYLMTLVQICSQQIHNAICL